MKTSLRPLTYGAVLALTLVMASFAVAADTPQTSGRFTGPKANTGTVSLTMAGGKTVLTLSDDFSPPTAPDPHWMIVDSSGTTYLLDRLMLKPDKINKSITLPPYVKDVAKVIMWCAFAETNLGEASFSAGQAATPSASPASGGGK